MAFKLNASGIDEIVGGGGTIRMLEEVAAKVSDGVEDEAPVETGHFQGSVRVLPVERTSRGASITVDSTDFAAHLVEWGSVHNPPYAPFRKAAARLGLKLRGGGQRK